MLGGINSLMSSRMFQNSTTDKVNSIAPMFDYKTAQTQSKSIAASFFSNNAQVKNLKDDSAKFLKQYTSTMNNLNSAADKLTNGNINKIIYDKDGAVTDATVKATVEAAKNMVSQYNDTITKLNNNVERGPGVEEQLYRLADDPAAKETMKLIGVSVNKDATLALDETKLTEALKTNNPDQLRIYTDALGGSMGVAAGVQRDARAGLRVSAGSLIASDLAQINSIRNDDPLRNMGSYTRSGAYALNNMAAAGMLMNLLA